MITTRSFPGRSRLARAMSPGLLSAKTGDLLSEAALTMLSEGVRHLPVLDGEGRVTGVLSVKDLLQPLLLDALASPA